MPVTSLLQERKLRYAVSPGKTKHKTCVRVLVGARGQITPP